ncbi:MetQ/NlpA family ABC transporter substrate-binding protein, partial [Escherichia coli]|nr:MetQ/NlpA family ABC transporter substrate-binding protein [Escherichia coli]
MKKLFFFMLVLVVALSGCGQANETNENKDKQGQDGEEVTLKVASLIPPMTEILDLVKPKLKEEGIDLQVEVLSDNVQPN